jgi:hypothetical protein
MQASSSKNQMICKTAHELYQHAKQTQELELLRFSDIPYMDLIGLQYAMSSDTGSGSFPKWFLDGYIIKINNNFRSSEPNGMDGINECFIFDLCRETGISAAPAYPVRVKYRLREWQRELETYGMINERFRVRKIDAGRLSENAAEGRMNFYFNVDIDNFVRMLFLEV